MCGRFSLRTPAQTLAEVFQLANPPALRPRYNIAPTQPVACVVKLPGEQARQVRLWRWGLIPAWAKDPRIGTRMINAQAETASTKPAFRGAFRKRRCLVLADGFYEWQRRERSKQPFYIRMRDSRPFAFAGLWEHWEGPDGVSIDSCTVLTTEPNDLVRLLHHRMPVILASRDYDRWLDPDLQQAEVVQPLLRPCPPAEMMAYPVSPLVNNPSNDTATCLDRLS